jgi:hypothetical protein
LQATCNASDFTVSNINLFVIKLVTIRILAHFDYAADTNVHLGNIRDLRLISLLCCGGFLFRRVLLLLLLGLLCHRSLWLCGCLRFGFLSDRLGLLSTIISCCLLGLKLSGSCGFRVVTTLLCELFKLTLGWCLCIFIREGHKEPTSLHLLKKTREMLNVINPSEGMR